MAVTGFLASFVSSLLIILIVIITFGFFLDVEVTGKVVSVEPSNTIPLGTDLAALLIIITIALLVIINMNLKKSG